MTIMNVEVFSVKNEFLLIRLNMTYYLSDQSEKIILMSPPFEVVQSRIQEQISC